MDKHYFTFGTHPEHVQTIEASTVDKARNRMFTTHGRNWGFQYAETEWKDALERGKFQNAIYLPIIKVKEVS